MSDDPPGGGSGGFGPGGFPFDPRMFEQVPLFRELAKVMSWQGGPVNWDLARQTGEAIAEEVPAPIAIGRDPGDGLPTVVGVAELWLDEVTGLGRVQGVERELDAREWVRLAATSEGLGRLVEPVARGMSQAMTEGLPEQLGGALPPGALGGGFEQAMQAVGAMTYGLQIGTVVGHLSGQLLGTYDLGLPTVQPTLVGSVGGTADRLAADHDLDATEVRYWLGLREALHRRMYAGVEWLLPAVSDLAEQFAGAASFDPTTLMEQLGGAGIDPSDPDALRRALEDPDRIDVEPTTEQKRVLEQLQALVAFVAGYADTVVAAAAQRRLTSLPRIAETMTRRRAEKGPGEQFLSGLLGLDLTPADVRAGGAFCAAVVEARGQAGLDRVWAGRDYLPRSDELAEPSRWLVRMAAAELDDPRIAPGD